ncbi:MAG: hypothetical protein GQ582_11855 [Methyloprofundus sp.]|nr:hypothetical protein [Methyloprofundus sp.]
MSTLRGITLFIGWLLVGMSSVVSASLFNRGTVVYDGLERNLIYDNELDVTWLDYTSDAGNYNDQLAWVSALSLEINEQIFDKWRLPIAPLDSRVVGYNIASSELGHLYYSDSVKSSRLFNNIPATTVWYTTGTRVGSDVWHFGFHDGWNTIGTIGYTNYHALALYDGDIAAASSVPEPSEIYLFISILASIGISKSIKNKAKE